MAALSPSRAAADNSRRCPGCPTRIGINDFTCPDCWVRLPFALQQPIQATFRRDEQAHQRALHSARAWYRNNQAGGR